MKKIPRDKNEPSLLNNQKLGFGNIGLVLSGGGSRAAYQVGALKALLPYLEKDNPISVIIGSSIGAVNGLVISAGLKQGLAVAVEELLKMWRIRTFKNSFKGHPSTAFVRAIKVAIAQYLSPGPKPTDLAIFDPTPLKEEVDKVIKKFGGITKNSLPNHLKGVGVMTTIEGEVRKPLLLLCSQEKIPESLMNGATFEVAYVDTMSAKHGFASAALPSVLPPVELNTTKGKVRLVDGGICQNVPVDPAVRVGADKVLVIDISGRSWWHDQYGEPHDKRPDWEVPAAFKTFCLRPPDTFVIKPKSSFGPFLKQAVSKSTAKFIAAVGPTWPIFKLLKNKMGEDLAYEVLSYVALDPDYLNAIIEQGYSETLSLLRDKKEISFVQNKTFENLAKQL